MRRPQDVIFQRPKDVGRGRPQDVGGGRPLTLHRGPYGDVHGTSFGDALRTSWGRNFAEWGSIMNYPYCICKAAYYMTEICLLSLGSIVLLETVFITKIYIKMPY